MKKYTVQELIDKLSTIEDKQKTIYIEGLSNFGGYYNVSGEDIIVEEDIYTVTLKIDQYNW